MLKIIVPGLPPLLPSFRSSPQVQPFEAVIPRVYSAASEAMAHTSHQQALSPARLEAFSDGVLAVIITIMVLELKVPHQGGAAGLHAILPILLVYLLSFTFTGIYWVNHHLLLHRIEQVDARILYSNLLFLFGASLLPFFTSWVLEKERNSFSVILYTACLLLSGGTFMLLRLAVERRLRLSGQRSEEDLTVQIKHWVSLGLYVVAIAVALARPLLALLLDALVTLVWILPDLGTRHRTTSAPRPPQTRSGHSSDISSTQATP